MNQSDPPMDEPCPRKDATRPVHARFLDADGSLPTISGPGGIMDGASGTRPALSPELGQAREIARDPEQDLEARLEAYEDIIDSEVGDTGFTRARNIEREYGLRQIYLKFEGGNPTGTQKDRIAFAQALDALRRGYGALTVATCGNYGSAMALAAELAGLQCFVFIPEGYHTRRFSEMESRGAEIAYVPGDYESAVQASRRLADEKDLYDANPGGANTLIQLRAYGEISYEVYDELREAPVAVALPVSNGTTLAGVHKGFVSLYRRGKTSHVPRVLAGSSYRKNPIIQAFLKKLPACEDLEPEKIRETSVNEPLVNWQSIDGDLALNAIRNTHGSASAVSDRAMLQMARRLRDQEGLSVLPASTAGLLSLLELHEQDNLPPNRYVAVITGRKA